MEVKIGVQHTPREIFLESGLSAEEVESAVGEAGRAMVLVHQALRIAEELSLEGFRRARAARGERALSSEDQSL